LPVNKIIESTNWTDVTYRYEGPGGSMS